MIEGLLLCLLTLIAAGVGTATGFGTSTIMIPVLTLFLPLPVSLLFVGIIHLCGDIWKVLLFKRGFDWKLILFFGLFGIAASYLGATLSFYAEELPLKRILGVVSAEEFRHRRLWRDSLRLVRRILWCGWCHSGGFPYGI